VSYAFKFGTAGIRARLGAKDSELNRESVRVIAHAIVSELATLSPDARTRGIAVAFDGRRESRAFAEEICGVALAQAFVVGLFEQETPTPLLAFTTRALSKAAGIMVTASHNPADDNGIKLYLAGGRQVGAPEDARIEARIAAVLDPAQIPRAELASARAKQVLIALGESELRAYLASIRSLLPARAPCSELSFGYSALYGVGTRVTRRLLGELGSLAAIEVEAHASIRADFGGLSSPNPEEPAALRELFALAEREQLGLAFAHDPDADRLAVIARNNEGQLRNLSGDEVGALIGDFLLAQHPAPETTLLASTLVSGGLLEQIARAYGASFVRSPTGFKWIAAEGRASAAREQRELLFGYEEALGYAFFNMADDKDGIAALAVLCTLAARLKAEHKSLFDQLAALSTQHGMFVSRQLSVAAHGTDGPERIARVMQRLRALAPETLLGAGARLLDYGQVPPELAGTRAAIPLLVFAQPPESAGVSPGVPSARVCVRPSGTEPKLKVYLHAGEPVLDTLDVAAAETRAQARLSALEAALMPYLDG
jgi:phosphomannomutase